MLQQIQQTQDKSGYTIHSKLKKINNLFNFETIDKTHSRSEQRFVHVYAWASFQINWDFR